MSLLLDALKKAAEDKEKSGNDGGDVLIQNTASNNNEVDKEGVDQESVIPDTSEGHESNTIEEELELELPEVFDEIESVPDLDEQAEAVETVSEIGSSDVEDSPLEIIEEKVEPAPIENSAVDFDSQNIESAAHQEEDLYETDMQLPSYDHNDARKILAVSQNRYRNTQRMMYYGMYTFSALLFFIASYFYYTTEILDNSDKPIFKVSNRMSTQHQGNKTSGLSTDTIMKTPESASIDAGVVKNFSTKKASVKRVAVKSNKSPTKKITIIKNNKEDPVSVLLQKAYQHYQSAEYLQADKIYQKVLIRDQRQRDAILGRAAIAVVSKKFDSAKRFYQQLIHYYPKDSVASAALVDLLTKEVTVANESQLNLLLRENPDAAHVYFSLGVLYEKQNRLKESQQSFFNAFSLNKKADYAFNLAVSLDRLGQAKAALSYYKQASELSDKSIIHFDEKTVLSRIETLEAGQ